MNRSDKSIILQEPDPCLHQWSSEVTRFDNDLIGLVDDLERLLRSLDRPNRHSGLGMAAPQIGQNVRVAAIKRSFGQYDILVNPKITARFLKLLAPAKCYSLPRKVYWLWRYVWVRVAYQDVTGQHLTINLFGPRAIVFQQELDHLNGILISDYVKQRE